MNSFASSYPSFANSSICEETDVINGEGKVYLQTAEVLLEGTASLPQFSL